MSDESKCPVMHGAQPTSEGWCLDECQTGGRINST